MQAHRTLQVTIRQLNQKFGAGTIVQLGRTKALNVVTFPSGFSELDRALGGGYPRGRIIEIYGPESSGKTALALHAIAQIQAEGGTAAFIDQEKCLCPAYAAALGVDISNLLVSRPETGEQAIAIMEDLIRSKAVDLVVIDSCAALVTQEEVQSQVGELPDSGISRLMSKALRRLMNVIHHECSVLFINQMRCDGNALFPRQKPTGGRALANYASVCLELVPISEIRRCGQVMGIQIKARTTKNKIAAPLREARLEMIFPASGRVPQLPGVGALALHSVGALR